jgi:hypothetical protein
VLGPLGRRRALPQLAIQGPRQRERRRVVLDRAVHGQPEPAAGHQDTALAPGPAYASGRGPGHHPRPAGDIQDLLAGAQAHALDQVSSPDRGDRRHEVTLVELRRIAVQLPPLIPVAGLLTAHVWRGRP